MNITGTKILKKNERSKTRITINEGGGRSSKTYSLCQMFIKKMLLEENILISVVRKTTPALKASVYKDFISILKSMGLYDDRVHNKSELTYKMGSNEIEFFSLDDEQKVRGRKRDYLWINEANELLFEDWQQLIMRTSKQAYLDYNPSEDYSWIYDRVQTRQDCTLIHSTYLDNPFLEPEVIKEIEYLKQVDENYWRIYGLGLKGIPHSTIYSNWSLIDELPEGGEEVYGCDFGFNNPSALVKVVIKDDNIYCDELIFESKLTNQDLINKFGLLEIKKNVIMYCDGAEAQRIEEIKQADYWAESADKSAGSVRKGIDTLKSRKIFITKRSVNLIQEIQRYKWKTKDGKILDEPVKLNDHGMDAIRYAVHTHLNQSYIGFV